jgi:hypothetical protein
MTLGRETSTKCEPRRQPIRLSAVLFSLQMNYSMERTSTASRSNLILTSGIVSAVLSATLFCVAYLVL